MIWIPASTSDCSALAVEASAADEVELDEAAVAVASFVTPSAEAGGVLVEPLLAGFEDVLLVHATVAASKEIAKAAAVRR